MFNNGCSFIQPGNLNFRFKFYCRSQTTSKYYSGHKSYHTSEWNVPKRTLKKVQTLATYTSLILVIRILYGDFKFYIVCTVSCMKVLTLQELAASSACTSRPPSHCSSHCWAALHIIMTEVGLEENSWKVADHCSNMSFMTSTSLFTRLEESILVPAGFLAAQFLQKT